MDTLKSKLLVAILIGVYSLNAAAVSVEITQSSLFLSVSGTTYQDDQQGYYHPSFAPQTNTFGAGFDISYSDSLDSNNLGQLTWLVTNNTGATVSSARFSGFLDAEIGTNQFWDEYAALDGDVTNTYARWEIDEPVGGNILDHLEADGGLDKQNSVPSSAPEDVSLALGFDINDWMDGQTILARFLISGSANSLLGGAGLAQHDAASARNDDVFYFSGSVSVVPIPGSAALMLSGLALMAVAGFRRKK